MKGTGKPIALPVRRQHLQPSYRQRLGPEAPRFPPGSCSPRAAPALRSRGEGWYCSSPPCSSCLWGIDWPISITPGHWWCVSCHKLYCGACRYKAGCLAVPEAQREHCAAPYGWVQCWPPAKVARAPALQVWLCPLPLFWSPRCGQIAPAWAAAKQRGTRAGSMRAARIRQAGTHVSIDIAFTFLVLSLFHPAVTAGSPAFPRRGQQ